MKKLLFLLFSCFCCICSVCAQAQIVLHYEQLLDSACVYLENNLIGEGETILLDLEENQEAPERIRLNATLVLANLYVNLGEADRLQESLLILDDYLQQHPEKEDIVEAYRKYEEIYSSLALYDTPFTERMCGLWVSTCGDRYANPILALAVYQDSIGNYVAELNEGCYFSKELSTQDDYEKHTTSDLTFLGNSHLLSILFGDERLRKSRPELAVAGVAATQQFTRSMSQSISVKNRKNLNSVKNNVEHTLNDIGGMAIEGFFRDLAIEKKHVKILDVLLQEIVPGMMLTADMVYDYRLQRSDGKNAKEHETRKINLYKVLPQDSVFFISPSRWTIMPNVIACRKNWMAGFSKDEKAQIKTKVDECNLWKVENIRQFH